MTFVFSPSSFILLHICSLWILVLLTLLSNAGLLNFILVRPHPVPLNKPPTLFSLLSDCNCTLLICRLSDFLSTPSLLSFLRSVAASARWLQRLAPSFIYRLLMMQRINENLMVPRSGGLPPVGGLMHDVPNPPSPRHRSAAL